MSHKLKGEIRLLINEKNIDIVSGALNMFCQTHCMESTYLIALLEVSGTPANEMVFTVFLFHLRESLDFSSMRNRLLLAIPISDTSIYS